MSRTPPAPPPPPPASPQATPSHGRGRTARSPAARALRAAARTTLLLALGASLTGCDSGHGTLVIGVRPGRPGLVDRLPGGGYRGFDIEVAGYVARRLGYRDDQVSYVELGPQDGTESPGLGPAGGGASAPAGRTGPRIGLGIAGPPTGDGTGIPAGAPSGSGRIDLAMGMLLAGRQPAEGPYPLSGPYLVSGQDILTGAGDLSVRRLKDLSQKRVCTGSPGPLVARFGVAWQRAFLITSTVEDCVRMLASRRVNAVTDDAAVLAGLAAGSPGRFRLVGHTFSQDKYGIAMREDSGDLHLQVDEALRSMFDDGSWRRAVIEHLGLLAAKYTSPPALGRYVKTRSAR